MADNSSLHEESEHFCSTRNIAEDCAIDEIYAKHLKQHIKQQGIKKSRAYRARRTIANSNNAQKRQRKQSSLDGNDNISIIPYKCGSNVTCSTSDGIVLEDISLLVQKTQKKNNKFTIPTCPYRLPPPVHCIHCNAKKFYRESKGFCCSFGKIKLHAHSTPNDLFELFTSASVESSHFRTVVRTYNNHFAFTSFGVKYDKDLCKSNKGIYTFRVQGQVYHYVNQLLPKLDDNPSHLQLYFYDTDHELYNRLQNSDKFVESVLLKIIEILKHNPYSTFFRSLNDKTNLHSHRLQIRCHPSLDQRVYNVPSVSQVAGIWVEDDPSADVRPRDISIYGHSGECHKVQYYYGCYDPLQYPLLFPHGEPGWHEGIERDGNFAGQSSGGSHEPLDPNNMECPEQLIEKESEALNYGKKRFQVSCREYYCYRLQIRSPGNFVLLHSGRLLQQYFVDMYIKIETSRLDYFRHNQTQIRAELYQGIVDSVDNGENRGHMIGKKLILPQSFTCGPRDMQRRYRDGMALVQRFGKPDVFLTMTCNPNWPEIKQELEYSDVSQNRPDLIARIFKSKLDELKNDLLHEHVLGEVAAYIYVIEFQKRGLPHAHFLLIFKPSLKIVTPAQIDNIVSCELPDENLFPYLHSTIVKHMMHGPCGTLNPKNVCMNVNQTCKNKYPREYCPFTCLGENSYPVYRRSNTGNTVKVRGQYLDNRWVVPHNRYLTAKFDCHINVEICSSVKAVKYLYKYVYKGHDRVSFCMGKNQENADIDEISDFQNGRWISPPEAAWRIFSFPLSEIHPTVISLQLHLQDRHLITYNDGDNLSNVITRNNARKTMLTEFFSLNSSDQFARTILYRDFPTHFVWNTTLKIWKLRKKQMVIGRVVGASPTEGERYFLRVLLNHIKGPMSFEHLKTVNGITVNTYRESALLHGLLIGDNHCEECMSDAIIYQMPDSLRKLFSTLLTLCNPTNPKNLWEKFKTNMFEDYVHDGLPVKIAEKKTLHQISCILEASGKNLNDYAIVTHIVDIDDNERFDMMVANETIFADTKSGLLCEKQLNDEQRCAYNKIMSTVTNGSGAAYFIDGPGGTGKTFLYKALLSSVRSKNHIALATASSGVAAALLPNGRTAHSTFKIPLDTFGTINCSVTKQSALGRILKLCKLIIWDEASMVNRCAIEALDRLLQDIMDSSLPFGGKVIVFGGDFRQVLPVIQRGKRADILKASLVCSPLWPFFIKLSLVKNMRSFLDPMFCEYLLRIGNGNEEEHTCDSIQLPMNITIPFYDEVTSLKNLINIVFPNIDSSVDNLHKVINRVILTAKNESVDQINNLLLHQIDGEMYTYYSFDETIDRHEQTFQEDFLNSLSPNGIPPHELNLKLNCPVMLLRNINPSEGLCNGTRLTCKKFDRNLIAAEIISGEYIGKSVFLPRIPFIPLQNDKTSVQFKRTQFPIRPCFAMTINKAQGQTLDFVGLYLPQPVFSHGQLYVALSRAKTCKDVRVLLKPSHLDSSHDLCTKNVVYEEIFMLMKR